MLLRRIKLRNFRQYHGDVDIRFATDKTKNITVIHAENGVGKTALLNAIKWCFYGNVTSNFRLPHLFINNEALKEGTTACSVEIEYENGDDVFLIIRTFDSKKNPHNNPNSCPVGIVKVFKQNNGVWGASLPEPELVINAMLPREMADYFFFQGEGSNAVETGNKGINLAKSIQNILGFKIAESTREFLRKYNNSLSKRIAQHDTTGEAQILATKVEELSDKLQVLAETIAQLEIRIPDLQSAYTEVDSNLAKINNMDLQTLRSEESRLTREISGFEKEQLDANLKKIRSINTYGWAVFGREFATESLDFIDESTLKGRLPEPYNQTFINDILKAAQCICGQHLEPGSISYLKIAGLLDKAANPTLQNRLGGIRAQIQDIKTKNDLASDTIITALNSADRIETQIHQTKQRLAATREKIILIPEEEIKKLQRKKDSILKDLTSQNQLLGGYRNRHEVLSKEFESQKRRLSSLQPNNALITDLNLMKSFIEELSEFLEKHLKKVESSVRLHIISSVNQMMIAFSRHSYSIKILPDDFSIQLVDSDNNLIGQGDGLNLLLNLSITAALIAFVRNNQAVRDPLLASATVAPLVIDAPFGVLDTSYRNVVVSSLPEHAEQVVFLVSSSQWGEDMDMAIRDRIGAEYCLILEQKGSQGEKQLDTFRIAGREFIANRYNCIRDRVFALEV